MKMNLSWEPLHDDSVAVAIARETKKPTNYKVVYMNPAPASGEDAPPTAASTYFRASHNGAAQHGRAGALQAGSTQAMDFGSPSLTLPPNGAWAFEPLPAITADDKPKREVYLVTGPSGSGKSHWIRSYATNYLKLFPENSVYLISSLHHDDTLDTMKDIKRIDIEKLVATPPKDVKTWANSLVIIDDIEGLDKVKGDAVYRVQDMVASEGRHSNTSLLRASHLSTDYKRTRLLLQEAHGFVIYPQSGAHSQYMYLLTKYGGMDKKAASALLATQTRWLTVHHTQPRFILSATTIYIPVQLT